jgi:CBS domain-containing protein
MQETLHTLLESKGHTVHSIEPTSTVIDAVRKMNEERIGAVLVMDGHDLVGIFTERDVLCRIVDEGRNPNSTLVADVMTAEPVVVTSTATVSEAMAIVSEKRCRHLPVVEDNRLVGLVSSGDLTHWVTRKQTYHIQDLMNFITDTYPR